MFLCSLFSKFFKAVVGVYIAVKGYFFGHIPPPDSPENAVHFSQNKATEPLEERKLNHQEDQVPLWKRRKKSGEIYDLGTIPLTSEFGEPVPKSVQILLRERQERRKNSQRTSSEIENDSKKK